MHSEITVTELISIFLMAFGGFYTMLVVALLIIMFIENIKGGSHMRKINKRTKKMQEDFALLDKQHDEVLEEYRKQMSDKS